MFRLYDFTFWYVGLCCLKELRNVKKRKKERKKDDIQVHRTCIILIRKTTSTPLSGNVNHLIECIHNAKEMYWQNTIMSTYIYPSEGKLDQINVYAHSNKMFIMRRTSSKRTISSAAIFFVANNKNIISRKFKMKWF